MKIAILQPYLFPYIGYFQLIKSVDLFVVYDDVQYIKRGWINRNRILVNNHDYLFTFSIKKDSQLLNINQRYFTDKFTVEKTRFSRILKENYNKTEYYNNISYLLNDVLDVDTDNQNIAMIITRSIKLICKQLDISTPIINSSEIIHNNSLRGEERIIEITKKLNASHYINPIGGVNLYHKESFLQQGLKLNFLKSKPIQYRQQSKEFIPWLSIIDILMNNSKEEMSRLLDEYELCTN